MNENEKVNAKKLIAAIDAFEPDLRGAIVGLAWALGDKLAVLQNARTLLASSRELLSKAVR